MRVHKRDAVVPHQRQAVVFLRHLRARNSGNFHRQQFAVGRRLADKRGLRQVAFEGGLELAAEFACHGVQLLRVAEKHRLAHDVRICRLLLKPRAGLRGNIGGLFRIICAVLRHNHGIGISGVLRHIVLLFFRQSGGPFFGKFKISRNAFVCQA